MSETRITAIKVAAVFVGILLLVGAVTQIDYITQVRNKPVLDVRQYASGSTTGGIQECLTAAGANGSCQLPAGITHVQNSVHFTATGQSLLGLGRATSIIQADYDSGDILLDGTCTSNTCTGFWYVTIAHLGIQRIRGLTVLPTSGVTLGIYGAAYVRLDDLWLRHNYIGLDTNGNCTAGATLGACSLVYGDHVEIEGASNIAINGYWGTMTHFNYIIAGVGNGYSVTYTPVNLIKILFADGTTFRDSQIGGNVSDSAILIAPPNCTNCRASLLNFVGIQTDGVGTGIPVKMVPGASNGIGTVTFLQCDWSTGGGNTNPVFRFLGTLKNIRIEDSQFVLLGNNIFDGPNDTGTLTSLTFRNNVMDGLSSGLVLMNLGSGYANVMITGNKLYSNGGNIPPYAVQATAAINNLTVSNNEFYDVSTYPFNITAAPTGSSRIEGNTTFSPLGIETVASAATVTLPVGYQDITLTGNTGVGTVNGLYEKRVVYIQTSAVVTFTAGATIGNTYTTPATPYVVVGVVLGGKLYLH
jgi:hypothetical protein